jgi:uncharacterized protein DUF6755
MTTTDRTPPHDTPAYRAGPRRPRARHDVPAAVGVFVIVLISLQIFLLTVAVDAFLADDDGLAWVTALLSVVLAAGSAAFYRYVR